MKSVCLIADLDLQMAVLYLKSFVFEVLINLPLTMRSRVYVKAHAILGNATALPFF